MNGQVQWDAYKYAYFQTLETCTQFASALDLSYSTIQLKQKKIQSIFSSMSLAIGGCITPEK